MALKKGVDNPGYSIGSFSFENNDDNGFSSKEILINYTEDELTPIMISFDKDYHLSYYWEDSQQIELIKEYPYKVGKTLPNILLKSGSDQVYLNSLRERFVVINWWATTCGPCVTEIPGLNKLVDKYPEVEFISIIHDQENLDNFLKKHEFKYQHYFVNKDIEELLRDR